MYCTLPIKGAKDNVEFLRSNLLTLLPELSESGQGIIYVNSSMIPGADEVDKVIQLWWYLIHIGSQNPMIRKNGFILLSNDTNTGLRNFQPKLAVGMLFFMHCICDIHIICTQIIAHVN